MTTESDAMLIISIEIDGAVDENELEELVEKARGIGRVNKAILEVKKPYVRDLLKEY